MKRVVAIAGTKICYVLNRFLEEEIFPSNWKEAIVVLVPKVLGMKKIEEFIPNNKLLIYEKILELIVHNQSRVLRE